MSVETDAWTAFKTQLQANTALASYVNVFKFNRQAKTFNTGDMPILLAYLSTETDEDFLGGMPKRKFAKINIEVHGKCHLTTTDPDDLETELLVFNALIKNAIESDLQMSDSINLVKVGSSVFGWLSDTEAEVRINVSIQTKRFEAGSR